MAQQQERHLPKVTYDPGIRCRYRTWPKARVRGSRQPENHGSPSLFASARSLIHMAMTAPGATSPLQAGRMTRAGWQERKDRAYDVTVPPSWPLAALPHPGFR